MLGPVDPRRINRELVSLEEILSWLYSSRLVTNAPDQGTAVYSHGTLVNINELILLL